MDLAEQRGAKLLSYQTPGTGGYLGPRTRQVAVILLLVLGLQVWLVWGRGDWGRGIHLKLLALAVVLGLIPPVHRFVYAVIQRVRRPSSGTRCAVSLAVAVLAAGYLAFTAHYQGRLLIPKWHDEFSYLLQMRMLAQGRLWMPAHPLKDFFDSFYILVEPVYASMYFPGASLLYVPGVWLGWPAWVMPVLVSGAVVGLVYRILAELLDGSAGLLGALLMLSLAQFRQVSTMVLAQVPVLLLGLLALWAYLRWREHRRWRHVAAIGLFGSWAVVTRPQDALCLVGPVLIAMAIQLFRMPWRGALRHAAVALLAAAPLLSVQAVLNHAVTGSWLKTPWEQYADRDHPQTRLGFHDLDPSVRPVSPLPQKQAMYEQWLAPRIRAHTLANLPQTWNTERLPLLISSTVAHPLLLVLAPVGLLGVLRLRRRLLLWAALPFSVGVYALYLLFLKHYPVPAAPAMILMILAGIQAVEETWRRPSWRAASAAVLTLWVLILGIGSLPEANRYVIDDPNEAAPVLRDVDHTLAQGVRHRPAVVLFHYDRSLDASIEPVYNTDVAWPDDAPVVRAHDLGRRNPEIFRYYAARQPERAFYLFDRVDGSLRYLGMAPALAAGSGMTSKPLGLP